MGARCRESALPFILIDVASIQPPLDSLTLLPPGDWQPWMGKNVCPVRIPVTTPLRYVSLQQALNLRLPGEDTGDWHETVALFTSIHEPYVARVAGEGWPLDSTPSLGSLGVRNMEHVLVERGLIRPGCGPVWVANHYRAIADYALRDRMECRAPPFPSTIEVRIVNKYLDTEAQVEHLLEQYIKPLRSQLNREQKEAFDRWIPTIIYE